MSTNIACSYRAGAPGHAEGVRGIVAGSRPESITESGFIQSETNGRYQDSGPPSRICPRRPILCPTPFGARSPSRAKLRSIRESPRSEILPRPRRDPCCGGRNPIGAAGMLFEQGISLVAAEEFVTTIA